MYSRELSQKYKNILWWTFQCQKWQKFKNSQPQRKYIGSYLKECTSIDACKPNFKWHKLNRYFVPSHSSRWLLIILSLSVNTCLRCLSWKILSIFLTQLNIQGKQTRKKYWADIVVGFCFWCYRKTQFMWHHTSAWKHLPFQYKN